MTNQECTALAGKIFKSIKSAIGDIKKQNKTRTHKKDLRVRVKWTDDTQSVYDPATKRYKWGDTTYKISVAGDVVAKGIPDHRTLNRIFGEVRDMLDEQRKVKGWSTIICQTESFRSFSDSLYAPTVTVITGVSVPDAPCKEYKSLENYLNKYGQKKSDSCWNGGLTSLGLVPFALYSVRAGGKRGRLYGEEGTRRYLANKPNECKDILETLRKHRTSRDTMVCRFGHEEYIDPMDRQHSEYYEVECDGEIREYLHIEIKTPRGDVKFQTDIY